MNRAHQRRIRARENYLARLALSDPLKFDAALRDRVQSWARKIRGRANILSASSAHDMADQIAVEMQQLATLAPVAAPVAADVAKAIRHTAMTEIARAVEPRMARLGIWPRKQTQ